MAEGILCNCLEAISRLQSQLQYLSILRVGIHMHTHAHVVVMPLHRQNMYTTSTYDTSIVALLYNYTYVYLL